MKTEIEFSPSYSLLTARLESGEMIRAEPGAMVAQQDVEMETGVGGGGLFRAARRMLGGESFLMNVFTAGPGGGWVSLAPPLSRGYPFPSRFFPARICSSSRVRSWACSGGVQVGLQFPGLQGFLQRRADLLPAGLHG